MSILMKCGHTAQGKDENGNPLCVICLGDGKARQIENNKPDLTDRKARCSYYGSCKSETKSSYDLPFFEHRPWLEFDKYYCGCEGWD